MQPITSADETRIIYCRLLNEGVDVYFPLHAVDLGDGLFRIAANQDIDRTLELEFPLGSSVRLQKFTLSSGEIIDLAVSGC